MTPRVLAPLRHRDFRLLWIGQTVSGFGNSIYAIAVPFQLLQMGASPLEFGVVATISTLGAIVFLLFGGAVADRVPRRRLILASDLIGGMVVGWLTVLSWSGGMRIEHVYVAAGVLGAASAFLAPAYNALVPELVPAEILQSGTAIRSLGRSVTRIAAPAVGGIAVVLGGPALGFGIDTLTFFFSFGLLLLARPPRREPPPPAPIIRDVREGLAFTFSTPWLWMASLGYAALNLAYAGQAPVMTPLLVSDVLRGDAATLGAIGTAYGIGVMAGGVALGQFPIARAGLAIYVFELIAAVAVVAIGLIPVVPAVLVSMALIGLNVTASDIVWQTALQRHIPQRLLGRVTSITVLGNSLLNPIGPLIAGALVASVGPAATFVVAGTFAAIVAATVLLASPVRRLR